MLAMVWYGASNAMLWYGMAVLAIAMLCYGMVVLAMLWYGTVPAEDAQLSNQFSRPTGGPASV